MNECGGDESSSEGIPFLHGGHDSLTILHVDEDVVRGMSVQRSAESLLVEMVTDETDAATEDEETVEGTNLKYESKYQSMHLTIGKEP